jgi:cell division septum initiation protein DivIVA
MSSEKFPRDPKPPASAADAAERLARIVDAAERAATSVIDDAERQAQRHLEEARERADRMVAERLRELADELDQPLSDGRRGGHLKSVETGADPVGSTEAPVESQADEPSVRRRSGSAAARLLATQMAVSGADRAAIEAKLRHGFEIEDTSEILDAILGPEG